MNHRRNLPSPNSKARNMDRANVSRRKSIIAECFGILKPSMYDLSDVSQICMNNIGIFLLSCQKSRHNFLGLQKGGLFPKMATMKSKNERAFRINVLHSLLYRSSVKKSHLALLQQLYHNV